MKLEQRLRKVEEKLKPPPKVSEYEPRYIEIPKETVVAALGILKDVGGYQFMLGAKYRDAASDEELVALNRLTPSEFYNMMFHEFQEDSVEIGKTS